MADTERDDRETPRPRPTAVTIGQERFRWVAPLALVVALVAVALATWALTRTPSDGSVEESSGGSSAISGDPKMRVCNAFDTVSAAVQQQTFADLGPDPVAQKAVAGNARLALFGGGAYLLSNIGPGTPPELADAVRAFGTNLQEIAMNALAEVPNTDPAQAARLAEGEASQDRIAELCA